MPDIEVDGLDTMVCLYTFDSYDNQGKPRVNTPVEIGTRWQMARRAGTDAQGNPIVYDAQVAVDREIPINSIVWKGRLDDLPDAPTSLWQVVDYTEALDITGFVSRRVVSLARYTDSLPEVV